MKTDRADPAMMENSTVNDDDGGGGGDGVGDGGETAYDHICTHIVRRRPSQSSASAAGLASDVDEVSSFTFTLRQCALSTQLTKAHL